MDRDIGANKQLRKSVGWCEAHPVSVSEELLFTCYHAGILRTIKSKIYTFMRMVNAKLEAGETEDTCILAIQRDGETLERDCFVAVFMTESEERSDGSDDGLHPVQALYLLDSGEVYVDWYRQAEE